MRVLRWLGALAILTLVVSLVLLRGAAPSAPLGAQPEVEAEGPASPGELSGVPTEVRSKVAREEASPTEETVELVPSPEIPPAVRGELITFVGTLVDPTRGELEVPEVSAQLVDAQGGAGSYHATDTGSIHFGQLQAGEYQLTVEVEGFVHRPETLHLSVEGTPHSFGGPVLQRRVTLWSPGFVPIVVRLGDGRPFTALAADRGLETKRLFVDAFRTYASQELVAPGEAIGLVDESLATFHRPSGYQNVTVSEGVAGSLELHAALPLWVGLWVYGDFYRGRILREGDAELVFVIDGEALDSRAADVTLQVLDRGSGAPVEGARVTLKADTSAHRRGDLSRVATDAEGRVHLQRAVPGTYELTIVREGHQAQRRLRIAAGANDLGQFHLGSGPGLRVRVVDAAGEPVPAWMEVGPFAAGSRSEDLYPPNLHRKTDEEGLYEAPIPDQLAMVRARPLVLDGQRFSYPDIGSRNALIDPEHLPAEIVLVAMARVQVRVEPTEPWVLGQRVELVDELGLIVADALITDEEGVQLRVVPGRYTVRRFDEHGRPLGALTVQVEPETRTVLGP